MVACYVVSYKLHEVVNIVMLMLPWKLTVRQIVTIVIVVANITTYLYNTKPRIEILKFHTFICIVEEWKIWNVKNVQKPSIIALPISSCANYEKMLLLHTFYWFPASLFKWYEYVEDLLTYTWLSFNKKYTNLSYSQGSFFIRWII